MLPSEELRDLVRGLGGELFDELCKTFGVLLLDLGSVFPMFAEGWIFDLSSISTHDGTKRFDSSRSV